MPCSLSREEVVTIEVLANHGAANTVTVLEDLKDAIGHEARRNLIIDLTHQEGTWEEQLAARLTGWRCQQGLPPPRSLRGARRGSRTRRARRHHR